MKDFILEVIHDGLKTTEDKISYLRGNNSLFIKSYIDKYIDEIIDVLKSNYKTLDELHNKYLFNKLVELKRFDLVFCFDTKILTEDFIINNIDKFGDNFSVYKYRDSKKLLEKLIELNNPKMFSFDFSLYDEELVKKYFDNFINAVLNYDGVPGALCNKKILFDELLKRNRFDKIIFFAPSLFNGDVIKAHFEEICNAVENNLNSGSTINMSILIPFLIEHNKLDLLNKLYRSDKFYVTKGFIYDNINLLKELIIKNNGINKNIIRSDELFESFLSDGNLKMASKFNCLMSREAYDKYIDFIINSDSNILFNINNYGEVLRWCLEDKKYAVISKIKSNAFDKQLIKKYDFYSIIKNEFNGNVPNNLSDNTDLLNEFIKHGDYDIAIDFCNQTFVLTNQKVRKEYAKILGLSQEEFEQKITKLLSKNDEVLNTLNLKLLSSKFNNLKPENIEPFAAHKDIQDLLLNIDEKHIDLFIKIINQLDNTSYDICPIIHAFLKNYGNYTELLNTIDINNLDYEKMHNLLIVMRYSSNYLNITDVSELTNESLKKLKRDYYKKVEVRISENNIGIEELRKNVFNKIFGLNMAMARMIVERYCYDIEAVKNSKLPKKMIKMLGMIDHIYWCENIEELKYYFIGGKVVNEDFYSAVSLESRIRKEFARLYSDTLYKPSGKDLLDTNNIEHCSYKGVTPQFYMLKDDFNMQIHVLGAYSSFTTPDDFKEDWCMPKIAHHGICTSYIGNNQIASARNREQHPIYGFSSYEGGALLLMGNDDLVSNNANMSYDTSYSKTRNNIIFLPPNEMINYTRRTHNEIVIERKNLNVTLENFKRMPDYIVYIVDDINDPNCFSKKNSYYNETLQAAVDHNLPIVIVDRLYYAKKEAAKCDALYESICKNKDYSKVINLIENYINNLIGCKDYLSDGKEYHKYFTDNGFEDTYKKIIGVLEEKDLSESHRISLITNLYKVISNEIMKQELSKRDVIDLKFNNKLIELKKIASTYEINFDDILIDDFSDNVTYDLEDVISNYYYSVDDKIRSMIYEDISNGLSNEEILMKINSGGYEFTEERENDYGRKRN